eukprot:CAMPEP_0168414938 /NCGR_PEP_ID=MMETSP0228-20121227/29981_1 /TAXON_ID=133427 /ORGANISM="Protoceratium reticulatum, Strain CCCM 535 (=CCMP 1889)" /LENGTH=318 /DNA_ID=CAMNT_0008428745 /DNA_START=67 /DNA_END=1023 /DNA_ORIENTATION=+
MKAESISLANVLPPAFIFLVVAVIWASYIGMHILALLQYNLASAYRDARDVYDGWQQLLISQTLVALLLICYVKAFLSSPGTVPDGPEWKLGTAEAQLVPRTRELKGTGERRHCKWCLKYKPDRCHHCRICKTCVLKMDHHCPWIMNCVGFRNHKYFFLLVMYSVLNCVYISCTMLKSVERSMAREMPTANRFVLVLGLVLAVIMGSLMLVFLSFHVVLMFRGMSTIEFCEKNTAGREGDSTPTASHDLSVYRNVCAVLGPRPLLWFLPVSPPDGSGVSWPEPEGGGQGDGEPSSNASGEDEGLEDPEWTGTRPEARG